MQQKYKKVFNSIFLLICLSGIWASVSFAAFIFKRPTTALYTPYHRAFDTLIIVIGFCSSLRGVLDIFYPFLKSKQLFSRITKQALSIERKIQAFFERDTLRSEKFFAKHESLSTCVCVAGCLIVGIYFSIEFWQLLKNYDKQPHQPGTSLLCAVLFLFFLFVAVVPLCCLVRDRVMRKRKE